MRDSCGGGGKSRCGESLAFAANQAVHFIAGKMASCLQITDTDFAYRVKCSAEQCGRELKREQRAAALQSAEGEHHLETWGSRELLEVVHRSLTMLQAVETSENLTMKSAARNGFLAWRPCMKTRTLYNPRDEEWMKDLPHPADSHRLFGDWLHDRWSWTAEGVPKEPAAVEMVGEEGADFPEVLGHDDSPWPRWSSA